MSRLSRLPRAPFYLAASVAVLLLLLGFIAVVSIDSDAFSETLRQEVQAVTGHDLTAPGGVSLSLFPWVGVRMKDARLANPPEFGDGDLLQAQAVRFHARLLPLLQGRFEVSEVELEGAAFAVVRAADGGSNWDAFLNALDADSPAVTPTAAAPSHDDAQSPDAATPLAALDGLDELTMREASLAYLDMAANHSIQLRDVRLTLSRLSARGNAVAARLSLGGEVVGHGPDLHGSFSMRSGVIAEPRRRRFFIKDFALSFSGKGAALPGGAADLAFSADISVDQEFNAIAVENASLEGYGGRLHGKLRFLNTMPDWGFSASVALDPTDPRLTLAALGRPLPPLADPEALGRVSARLQLEGNPQTLAAQAFELDLDDAKLSGFAKLSPPAALAGAPVQAVEARLQLTRLDVDRYLAAIAPAFPLQQASRPAPDTADPTAASRETTKSPASTGPSVNVVLSIHSLRAMGAQLANVAINVLGESGMLHAAPVRADLYGGGLDADLGLNVAGGVPQLALTGSLSNINVGNLLQDMTGEAAIRGRGVSAFTFTAQGLSPAAMAQSLSGAGSFRISNGGLPVLARLPEMLALPQRAAAADLREAVRETSFTELRGAFSMADGVAATQTLRLESERLDADAEGLVDIAGRSLDVLTRLRLPAGTLPVRLRGPWRTPELFMDPVEQVRLKARGEATLTPPPPGVVAPEDAESPFRRAMETVEARRAKVLEDARATLELLERRLESVE